MGMMGIGVEDAYFNPAGELIFKLTSGSELNVGEIPVPFDDYKQVEYLNEQAGSSATAGVLTFTFSAPVQFIVVELVSTLDQDAQAETIEALEGSAASGGTVPTATKGAVLKHEIPVTLLDDTDTVRTFVPGTTDYRVRVYGKRRVAV